MKAKDIVGQKFGHWKVIGLGRKTSKIRYVKAQCSCGTLRDVQPYALSSGKSTSCGCKKVDKQRNSLTRHGDIKSSTYGSWQAMRRRCLTASNHSYKSYGGSGIEICKRWDSYENFVADMGSRPKNTSLDRINNKLGYSPENCRWASPKLQAENRSSTKHYMTYQGTKKLLTEWARENDISPETLYRRFVVLGWNAEKAIETPVRAWRK